MHENIPRMSIIDNPRMSMIENPRMSIPVVRRDSIANTNVSPFTDLSNLRPSFSSMSSVQLQKPAKK